MNDNSSPWHPNLSFASFDIVMMDIVMQGNHKMIIMHVNYTDNQIFTDSWGYLSADDSVHRMVTLRFGISGRYFLNPVAKMLYGDSYQWSDATSAVYVDAIYGINCI